MKQLTLTILAQLSNGLHLQWFSMLWNRDHSDHDHDTGGHVKTKADAEAAAQKYAYVKAAWAKKVEEMAAAGSAPRGKVIPLCCV